MRNLFSSFFLTIFLTSFPFTLEADIADPVQKKDWFYLQTLSKQTSALGVCVLLTNGELPDPKDPKDPRDLKTASAIYKDWDTVFANYYDLADQLGKEVRLYIKNYSTGRSKGETEDAFAYRVWYSVIVAGLDTVEEAKKKRHLCPAILKSPSQIP